MDEEIKIITTNNVNQKIRNFFLKNKKNLIIIILLIVMALVGYISFDEIKKRNKIKIANEYNSIVINFDKNNKTQTILDLTDIVNKKDKTYSPLALYFLIDNRILDEKNEINNLFDILINKVKVEREIKNLIIYKKALYNSNFSSENELIQILKPITNSQSIWKSHALYLMAEYFYKNDEKQKAKEFFNKILSLSIINNDIEAKTAKRLNRDFSE